jgi:hypothetical protein
MKLQKKKVTLPPGFLTAFTHLSPAEDFFCFKAYFSNDRQKNTQRST